MRACVLRGAAGLLAIALVSACAGDLQVRWDTYGAQLQARIDSAAAAHDCQSLRALRADAAASSGAHERATGTTNDALRAYIGAAARRVGCPIGP